MVEEMKGQMVERLKNPLYITFTISWISWNYPFVLAILSGMTFSEKISYLNSGLYNSSFEKFIFTLGLPTTTTLLVVYALPFINRYIILHWKKSNLSIEHNEKIYKENLQNEKNDKLEKLLNKEEEINSINKELLENSERIAFLNHENQSLKIAIQEKEKIIKSLSSRLNEISETFIDPADTFQHIGDILNNIKDWEKVSFHDYEELISDTGKYSNIVRDFIKSMSLIDTDKTNENYVKISQKGKEWLAGMVGE